MSPNFDDPRPPGQTLLIRACEEAVVAGSAAGQGPGTCTLVGQEAAAVGVVHALRADHLIRTNRCSAGHPLARGADPRCVVVVYEVNRLRGVGVEIAAVVAEEAFAALKAPIVRLGGPDAPVAASYPLDQALVPQSDAIAATRSGSFDISRREVQFQP